MDNIERLAFLQVKQNISIVFDVGAREDGFEFVDLLPDAEYHFFEPNPIFAESLTNNLKNKHNTFVNRYGLLDECIHSAKYYESIQSFIPHPFIPIQDSGIEVDLKTLDWYVDEKKVNKIDFLKIDAEGCDYKILLGAKKTISLNKIKYIQFEYWDGVKKFYDLLKDKYELFFIEDYGLKFLSDEVIFEIDHRRIPLGLGGNIFCVLKKEFLNHDND